MLPNGSRAALEDPPTQLRRADTGPFDALPEAGLGGTPSSPCCGDQGRDLRLTGFRRMQSRLLSYRNPITKSITGRDGPGSTTRMMLGIGSGVPKGIRTPVTAVKGQCPRPLDDRDFLVSRVGIEPTTHSLKGCCSTD